MPDSRPFGFFRLTMPMIQRISSFVSAPVSKISAPYTPRNTPEHEQPRAHRQGRFDRGPEFWQIARNPNEPAEGQKEIHPVAHGKRRQKAAHAVGGQQNRQHPYI